MNPQGTSFIPKRPTVAPKKRGVRKVYVLTYISYILFLGTLLAVAGTFFFSLAVQSQLEDRQQALANERTKFSQSDIESVRELAHRISTAEDRMEKHISVLSILEALEQSALQTLQFKSFSYSRTLDGAPEVTLLGNTAEFNSVLFQRQVLLENPILQGGTFNEVALAYSGDSEDPNASLQSVISFELSTMIDPALVKYAPRYTDPSETRQAETSLQNESEMIADELIEAESMDIQ